MSESRSLGLGRSTFDFVRAALDPECRATLKNWEDYLSRQDCLSYVGWVGHGNLGDEWIFEALQRLMSPYQLISSEWGISPQIRAYSAMRLRKRHPFQARLVGGGTLFPRRSFLGQLTRPDVASLPLYVFGMASLEESFWRHRLPDDFSESSLARWTENLCSARFIGVRDEETADAVRALGAPAVRVVGDPAMMLGDARWMARPHGPRANRALRIGVNLGAHDPSWGGMERLRRAVVAFAGRASARGHEVSFIPLSEGDEGEGSLLRRALPAGKLRTSTRPRPREAMASILDQDVVVGQRLHSMVLPSAFGIPTISLAYNPKCLRFMNSIGRSAWAIRTDECSADLLESKFDALLDSYDEHSEAIWRRAEESRAAMASAAADVLRSLRGA